ncbi:MAG: hypothetical protein KatS3mg053_1689 [Candidatus Roseilinea sp.]|jgi:hypothetical protein|nr:MAG: hypothetical protein KatS3mg053_1689 [Candidatus Roseilinea sp.]
MPERDACDLQIQGRWAYYHVNKAYLARVYPALCGLFNPDAMSDARAVC